MENVIKECYEKIEKDYFLFGLLNAFMNQMQAAGDRFFEEISWKQCFAMICINMFSEPPAIMELAEVMGSSHQNVKQILLKLEKTGFVKMKPDDNDRRKLRVHVTKEGYEFFQKYEKPSDDFMKQLFDGIKKEDIETTIQTVLTLEQNLSNFKMIER